MTTDAPSNEDRLRGQMLRSYFLFGCGTLANLFLAAFLLLNVIGLTI